MAAAESAGEYLFQDEYEEKLANQERRSAWPATLAAEQEESEVAAVEEPPIASPTIPTISGLAARVSSRLKRE